MPDSDHIVVISAEEAQTGKTYIIGDVHGAETALRAVLSRLKPEDRLIIAGDLIDRGLDDEYQPASAKVLDIFREYHTAPEGTHPKLYCIKGNHEVNFLKVLDMFANINAQNTVPRTVSKSQMIEFFYFIKDGGAWIFNRDGDDQHEQRLALFREFQGCRNMEAYFPAMKEALLDIINATNPMETLLPNLMTYKELIDPLPFVIKIEGAHPTWVAHADLEFSDEEMARRILSKEPFTEEEIRYMTNARMSEFQPSGPRNCDSYQVVVGHNIIDMPEQTKAATPVRPLTNHINLDAGAYFTNGFLLLNVTDNSVDIVGRNISTENLQLLQYGKETIQAHLGRHSLENEEAPRPHKRIRFTL